jgi:hypothetical protein
MLEDLVDNVYNVMKKQYIYKKNSEGKFVSSVSKFVDQTHGAANRTFRKTEEKKCKLPLDFWK